MKPAVLFDLGNTLAAYYRAAEFEPILEQAIRCVIEDLESHGLADVPLDSAMNAAIVENTEAADYRFLPMAERLARIFRLPLADDPDLAASLCRSFLRPIFAVGRVYEDALPTLAALRERGYPVAIVSNAPWGSPPALWREELDRLGLGAAVDAVVLCGDVGWRKPAAEIFDHAAASVGRDPEACYFVGDDLHWDAAGSAAAGMRPVLVDREGRSPDYDGLRVRTLAGIPDIVAGGGRFR